MDDITARIVNLLDNYLMTEDNFVDYVKIHVSSGKGGSGSTHLRKKSTLLRDLMEVTVVEEVT